MARVRRVGCEECNELTQKGDLSEINGTLMCPECADKYEECASCGMMSTDMTDTSDGMVCPECRDNGYVTCDECGEVYNLDNMVRFNDSFYCEDCHNELVGVCEDCGSTLLREDLSGVGNNVYIWVCSDCVNEYHTCPECGGVFETLHSSGLCADCHIDSVDNIIESYNYKPDPIFLGEGDRFFGVELETEPCNDGDEDVEMVKEVQEYVSKWAYLKYDGSLCDGGFELVTHPMTLQHHLEKFTPELFKTIRDSNYVSHKNGNCGLHIHISRSAFKSELAIVKLLEFVYGNYDNIVAKLGRRGNTTRYCLENVISSCPMSIERIFRSNNEDRYHAINTKNRDTIELRFFRGTLVRNTFVAALQFADVLVNLANNIEDISKKIEWSDVFIEINDLGYSELSDEIVKRLDVDILAGEKYEGYKIEVGEELKTTRLMVVGDKEYEISSSICNEPTDIEWTREDILNNPPEVIDEFNSNYINRYELDRQPADVPTGIIVQIMPLTMMIAMRMYGRSYPSEMDCYAGGIYKVVNCGNFYRLEDEAHYTFDRSSFRVLSEQELSDRGL